MALSSWRPPVSITMIEKIIVVAPTTEAACSSVPFILSSVSTIFFALSQAPPALAMKMAWNSPNSAIDTR